MNFSMKNHKLVDQNESELRKPQKHDANLQKNTTLYFQVGLILVLLLTYGLFEMNFQKRTIEIPDIAVVDNDKDIYVKDFQVYDDSKKSKTKKQESKPQRLITKPIIIDNYGKNLLETPNIITPDENTTGKSLDPGEIDLFIPDEEVFLGIDFVQQVPIYPGCEKYKTNQGKKKCMSDKIGKLISRKFDTGIASKLGLEGRQRINVLFKIDKQGNVTNIQASAKHSDLVKETERVVNKIPRMIPGKQEEKEVSVLYTLPILFKVQY